MPLKWTYARSGAPPEARGAGAARALRPELVLRRLEPAGAHRVLAHRAGPVVDDPAARGAVPVAAAGPHRAGEAPLDLGVVPRGDLGAHGEGARAGAQQLDGLADVP